MKKLSKIDESVWGDIHKRSSGTKVKKEDDVNLMSSETFFDYVYSRYKGKVAYCNMLKVDGGNDYSIQTEIVLGVEVSIIYHNNKCSYILIDLLDNAGIETTAMINDFDVSKISSTTFDIKEKNGSISNQTYVSLVDFLLQNKDIIEISESVWADIHKRANGEQTRKEDDVNFLSGEGLCDYIKNIYDDSESKYPIRYYNNTLYVPLYSYRRQTNRGNFTNEENIFYDFDGEVIYVLNYISAKVSKLLEKNYNLEPYSTGFYKILPKDGSEINNKFFIGIIDYVLDNIDDLPFKKLLVKKEVNESVWGDIYKRSNGVESRKEDKHNMNIHMMNPVDLGSDVPVYFADIDLEVNGETEFTWEDVLSFLPEIEKTGWELLCGPKGVQYLFYNGNQPPRFNDEDYEKEWIPGKEGILRSRETKEELHFYTDNKYGINYWCVDDDYTPGNLDTISHKQRLGTRVTQRGFEVGDPNDYNGCLIRTNNFMVDMKCRIRLIKDK